MKSRRFLSMLLTLALMCGLFVAMPMTAYAGLKNVKWSLHPQSQTVTEGATVTFDAGVSYTKTSEGFAQGIPFSGDGYFQYQIPGSSSWEFAGYKPFTLTATSDMNGYKYRYKIYNGSDAAYSNIAVLTVKSKAPVITKQPEDKAVNGATSFAVAATGTGTLTYQWYVREGTEGDGNAWKAVTNGGVYYDATTSILSLSGAPDGGYNFTYYCKVTNKNGSCQAAAVSSASASLLTLIIPDYVPEPPHIITHPKNRTIKIGGSTTFSIEAEGEGLYYEWQYRESDGAYWQPVPNGYGHSGEGTPTLTLTDIDSVYDGVFYRCEVYSYGIIVHSDQAKLTLIEPLPTPELATTPIINQQPADRSVPAGRSTSFYVDASISRGYQWQVLSAGSAEWKNVADGGIYSGAATDTLKLSKPSIDYNGCQYRCVVSGIPGVISTPTVTSNAAKLTVTEAIPIKKHGEVVISGTSGMTLELGYAATSTEAYDIKSKGTATVTKTSGDAKITWNNGTKKLDIAAGLAQGTYPVVLTAASGSDTAEFTFTLTVTDALEQPDISGTSGMTLEPGYEATSTDPLTITGAPAPTVTKTSGNDKITWNNGTKKIDIAAGLAKGNYVVVLKAVNIAGETEFAFTLTVADPPPSEEEGEEETAADPSLSEEDGEEPSGSMSNFRKLRNYTPGMFTDVDEYSWYGYYQGKVICNAYEYGLMQGNSATTFNPTGNITIAEAITVAARVHSIYSTGADNFTPGEPWYKVYVDYAITNKIIAANDFTDYSRAATRAEMAYIFSRSVPESELAPQNTVNSLPDVNSGTPYYNAIIMLYKAGVLAGNDDAGTFHPGNNITRAEAAAIISRVILPATRINGKTFGK